MSNDARFQLRLPGALAEAVRERAEALDVTVGDVLRAGAIREITAPADRRSRMFVDAWLEGRADVSTDEAGVSAEKE